MYILCVCSCICGIAHTYMAAASLKKAGDALGVEVKVETQGAKGAENLITEEDIKRADGAIIASDVQIRNPNRFDDIPTLEVGVSEAIKHPVSIIKELLEAIE